MKQGLDTFTLSMEPYLPGRGNRRIWVYLPPDYQKSLDSYPVIYLTSAQHIFGSETGANITELTDWKFDEKLDWIYNTYGRGIIAVAVEYDAHYPWDEYSAWDNDYMYDWIRLNQNFDGKADALLRFIVEELKPTIDKRYRTLSEGENTAIGGGSRHALFALYAGLERPDVFSRIMAMSPAIWVANNSRTWLKNNGFINWFGVNSAPGDVRYYLYVGTKEWSTHTPPDITQDYTWDYVYLDGVNKTKSKLISDGVPDQNIYKDVNIGGDHYPEVWSHYVDDALEDLGFFP
jgi:predicted alpha/beta superfamily hydrolase